MRDYSKVSGAFWTGGTGKELRGDMQAQIIALYLMTSPHSNMIGIYHCPIIYIAHETGSSLEGAFEGLKRLCEGGFCTYDEASETVWVHEMARYQIGDELKPNDNRVKDIQKQFMKLPYGLIRQGFADKYGDCFHLPISKPLASPLQAPAKPEAGTEAGTEENPFVASDADDARSATKVEPIGDCPQKEILALYAEALAELPQPRIWDGQREKSLAQRWRWVIADLKARGKPHSRADGIEFFRGMFGYIRQSDFLMGRTGRWTADLGWIVKAENFAKILQGNYENKEQAA